MNKSFVLEICIDSIHSAINAINGGANRLEICSSLKDDGLTPTNGLIIAIHNYLKVNQLENKVQLFAMIRARGGDFVYSDQEIDQMIIEIKQIKSLGLVSGFVFGALKTDGCLDVETCQLLLNECTELENTFHRAIDFSTNPYQLLEQIIGLGFKRVITSGLGKTAFDGLDVIRKLIEINRNRIKLSPASGINDDNLEELIQQLDGKTNEYHGSAKICQKSKMTTDRTGQFDYDLSNETKVSNMVKIGRKFFLKTME